jgi:putative hydrolase of the HAD superfamily
MNITTVVFDFGNVLGFFSHRKAAEQLAAYTDSSAESIQAYLFGGQLENDYEAGKLTTPVFRGMVRERFHLRCTDDQFDWAFSEMFEPNPPICRLAEALKPAYRLFLLSNTNDLHYRHFAAQFADVLRSFDGLVLSHEVGVRKPQRGIYEACQQRAGCPASELLFIDDLPANIEGAEACGWSGIVYRRGDDLRAELVKRGVAARD